MSYSYLPGARVRATPELEERDGDTTVGTIVAAAREVYSHSRHEDITVIDVAWDTAPDSPKQVWIGDLVPAQSIEAEPRPTDPHLAETTPEDEDEDDSAAEWALDRARDIVREVVEGENGADAIVQKIGSLGVALMGEAFAIKAFGAEREIYAVGASLDDIRHAMDGYARARLAELLEVRATAERMSKALREIRGAEARGEDFNPENLKGVARGLGFTVLDERDLERQEARSKAMDDPEGLLDDDPNDYPPDGPLL